MRVYLLILGLTLICLSDQKAIDTPNIDNLKEIDIAEEPPQEIYYQARENQDLETKRVRPPGIIDTPYNCPEGTVPDDNGKCRDIW
uniref:Putative secreted protein n=1 Tax=Xenopsylla cheopis TaxID=163159 RepID=A0A6M2DXX2_XENCH